MTLEESLSFWQGIADGVGEGARVTAEAMARYLAERAANDTLKRTSHPPGQYYKAPPGAPPAYVTGQLASSMYWTRGRGGSRATAAWGNRDPKAKMLEYGDCDITPRRASVMHWTDSGGSWYHARLPAEEHPFMGPTAEEAIADGSLREVAVDTFREYDP